MLLFEAGLFTSALIVAITIHEAAHCFAADWLGDPTPRSQGRTTLNPSAHLDLVGSILLPLFAFISNSPLLFGWGKPAPFDPYNLKNARRDTALIALAGPVSNLLLAIVLAIILHLSTMNHVLFATFILFIRLNVSLALFNLLPIPPLDGSKIVGLFLSHEAGYKYQHLSSHYSYLLVFIFILPLIGGVSLASLIISPVSHLLLNWLIPTV